MSVQDELQINIKKEKPDVPESPDMETIMAFNQDQIDHLMMVQQLVYTFVTRLMGLVFIHDRSKFSPEEYGGFLQCVWNLRNAKSAKDPKYAKALEEPHIQHHYKNNAHHPEFYNEGQEIPVEEIIVTYFDWMSRRLYKGFDGPDKFRDTNLQKFEKWPHAQKIIELLELSFPYENYSYDKNTGKVIEKRN